MEKGEIIIKEGKEERVKIKKNKSNKTGLIIILLMGSLMIAIGVLVGYTLEKIKNPVKYSLVESSVESCKITKIEPKYSKSPIKTTRSGCDLYTISEIGIEIFDTELKEKHSIKITKLSDVWIYLNYNRFDEIAVKRNKMRKKEGQTSKQAELAPEIKYEYQIIEKKELKDDEIESQHEDIIDIEIVDIFRSDLTAMKGVGQRWYIKYKDINNNKAYGEIVDISTIENINIGEKYKAKKIEYQPYAGEKVTEYKLIKSGDIK